MLGGSKFMDPTMRVLEAYNGFRRLPEAPRVSQRLPEAPRGPKGLHWPPGAQPAKAPGVVTRDLKEKKKTGKSLIIGKIAGF